MKPLKIFTIGGATFDIFLKPTEHSIMTFEQPGSRDRYLCLKHGGKVTVQDVLETFGGGASNTAVGFARMGFDAAFVGMVGLEYSSQVIANLKRNHVNTKFVQVTDKDKTSFSTIINTFDGDRTVLLYPGSNRYLTAADLPMADLTKTDWIFLNHLSEMDSKIPAKVLSILKKYPRIRLAWNPGREQLAEGAARWAALLKHTTLLFLNKEEAAQFSGRPYRLAGNKQEDPQCHLHVARGFLPPYADDVSDIMMNLLKTGVKTVVITDGRNGAQASDGERVYFCPVVSTRRVDSLGAGDAFACGFTSAYALDKSLKACLMYGTLNATSVVGEYGAQAGLLTLKGIEARLKAIGLCVTSTALT